jgi:hypothetical protein
MNVNLEGRLNRLELKMKPEVSGKRAPLNTDDCILKLGLDPVAIRESAHMASSSLAEAISLALGIESRELLRLIRVKAELVRSL